MNNALTPPPSSREKGTFEARARRPLSRRPWFAALLLAVVSGCADSSMVLKGRVGTMEKQQKDLLAQNQELQRRLEGLNKDSQDATSKLAQAQQQTEVAEAKAAALNEQLRDMTAQLAKVQSEKQNSERKAQNLTASMQRQTGVSITPNNSFLQTLPAIQLPETHVRRDGDVIRVELPGNRLFESGGSRLRPGAANLVADAANEIRRNYPEQIIGIEGHTDSDPIAGGQWRNNHELSIARAMAIYDVLVASGRYRADQVFVVGHGANHPVVSNATAEGKQRNRRVELVIYPEKRGQ